MKFAWWRLLLRAALPCYLSMPWCVLHSDPVFPISHSLIRFNSPTRSNRMGRNGEVNVLWKSAGEQAFWIWGVRAAMKAWSLQTQAKSVS